MIQIARWTAIIALFTIPFLPLYVSNELFFPFITGKGFVFRILVEVAAAAYIVLAVLDARYRPRFSWTLVLFTGFVLWMAVANALGVNPHKAFWSNFERMDGWVTLVHVFVLFVVAGSVLTVEKLWRRWWLFFLSIAALVCGYGFLQLMGAAQIHQGGARVDASFGNAIYLAVYLMFSFFVAVWLAIESKGWLRYSLVALSVASIIVLFFTASRGAVIGLVAGAGFAALLWILLAVRGGAKKSLSSKIALGTLAVLLVLAGSFYLARDSAFVQSEPALSRLSTVFALSEELKVRSTIWGMAFEGVKEDPFTGWGQEGFNQVFNKYYDPSLFAQETWFDRAHNMYIDWLVAGGFPALILFVLLLVAGLVALLRASGLTQAKRVLLMGALVAYAVQALVVFDNLFSYIPLVMLLAMAHAASQKPIPQLESAPELKGQTAVGALGAISTVSLIAIVMLVNVPNMNAANHLVYAASPLPEGPKKNLEYFRTALEDGSFATQEIREQLVIHAARISADEKHPKSLRKDYTELALVEMGKEVERSPNDARLRAQYSSIYDAVGDKEGSLFQIEKAIELSPRKQALHLNRGFKLLELGRLEESRAAFRYAYDLDTSFNQVAIAAAAGYILAGDNAGAKELLMESVGTTTPDDESLFYAYYQTKQWDDFIAVARVRVTATNGSIEARLRLAQALATAGRFAQARTEINAVMVEYPEVRVQAEALLKQIPATR